MGIPGHPGFFLSAGYTHAAWQRRALEIRMEASSGLREGTAILSQNLRGAPSG